MCAAGAACGYFGELLYQLIWNPWQLGLVGKYCKDFSWIWLSSRLAAAGALAQAYDYSTFSDARALLPGQPHCILEHLDYPPTLFLFTYPLSAMPYAAAGAMWGAGTLLVYLAAVYAIIPRPAAIAAALAPYPVFINTLLGHVGFLTAGIIGLSLVSLERRPRLCGVFLALLTYKPQFGLLFPPALIAGRRWQALFAAVAATAVLMLVTTFAFGLYTWPAFAAALAGRAERLSADRQLNFWLISVAGCLRVLGAPAAIAWVGQAVVTLSAAAAVSILWTQPIPYSLKAAALAAGSVLGSPHAFGYDALILTIAAAFLVRDGLARGFLRGERTALLMCWAGLFPLRGPIAAVVCATLLALVLRRAGRFRREAAAAPGGRLPRPIEAS